MARKVRKMLVTDSEVHESAPPEDDPVTAVLA